MSATSRVLEPDDGRWEQILAQARHDFYHLPAYLSLEATRLEGRAAGFLAESRDDFVFFPVILRPVPAVDGVYDATSPYGYGCPLFSPGFDNPGLLTAALDALREQDVCAVFLRLHPLLPGPLRSIEQVGQVVTHGETVWLDLERDEEEQRAGYRPVNRNIVRNLQRDGYIPIIDEGWERLDQFLDLYDQTMHGVGAEDWYRFGRTYFEGLRDALGDSMVISAVEHEGMVTCAGLFSEINGIVQYHLSGSAESHKKRSPTRLMLDHVRQWATQRRNQIFHLGGGLGASADSLFKFKAGFSKLRAQFRTWRLVVDDTAYDRAFAASGVATRPTSGDLAGYFPAYREPIDDRGSSDSR